MTHVAGSCLGGIRTLEDLRGRCVIDSVTGCWHLRSARGRLMPRGKRHAIWVNGVGCISATRAAWLLQGREVPEGHVVYRCCTSYDCVLHLGTRTRTEHGICVGRGHIAAKTAANRKAGAKRSKVDAHARARFAYSQESLSQMARELGISVSWAWTIKRREREKTIGELRAAA